MIQCTFSQQTGKMPAANERFGATAAGRADLKGSAGMPPLTPSRPHVAGKAATARSREQRKR